MHYDYQTKAQPDHEPTLLDDFWTTDTRFPRTDPIWDFVIHAAKHYGNVRSYDHDFRMYDNDADRLLAIAASYVERETFEFYALEVVRLSLTSFAWEVNPFGSSPGGEPYMETFIRRYEQVNGKYVNQTYSIAAGLTENYGPAGESMPGTRWYVDFKTEGGDLLEYVYMDWREATPSRLVGWVKHFYDRRNHYPFQADFGQIEE